jgi:hypothetical protein
MPSREVAANRAAVASLTQPLIEKYPGDDRAALMSTQAEAKPASAS